MKLILILAIMLFSPSTHNCYERWGNFVYLNDNAIDITGVSIEELSSVDGYLRDLYGDDSRVHVYGYYADSDAVNAILTQSIDWSGYNGLTLHRLRWNFDSCAVNFTDYDERVNVSLARTGFSAATQFGLFLHELSHANGAAEGTDADQASWWERIGNAAYAGNCRTLSQAAAGHCEAIAGIIHTTGTP